MPEQTANNQNTEWDEMVRGANSERKAGNVGEAARLFDTVLAAAPGHSNALHGKARLALACGESDALSWFEKALKADPGNADLWLGKAQALDVAGDAKGARLIAKQICDQAPSFIAALEFLAGLSLAAGDADFAEGFRIAASSIPQDPNIPAAHTEVLAGLDYAGAAADVAREARKRFPNEPHFALLEAANASADGQWDRAEAIFSALNYDAPFRKLHEARHCIRAGDTRSADGHLQSVLAVVPWNTAAWALRAIVWRMDGDARADWLHDQDRMIQLRPVQCRSNLIDDVVNVLRTLHETSAMPLSQSLRGGTQTRGVLFHRHDAVLDELHQAILATLEDYRAELPNIDKLHPLLRHKDSPWKLTGSWSVRLQSGQRGRAKSGDYHTSHIHPGGILSSALYCQVPEIAGDENIKQGWLELGRPPADLGLKIGPICMLKPLKGHLALFPSTLYHGTSAFVSNRQEERITTAFDVAPEHFSPTHIG